jgi:hypothetical protein
MVEEPKDGGPGGGDGGEAKGWRRRNWRCGEVKGVEVGSGNCGGGS